MGRTKFTEGQIKDEDNVTNDEIGAGHKDTEVGPTGTWPVTTSSVNTSTNTITVSGIDFTALGIEPEDVVALTGGPNAGDYTVLQVTSATELQVNENLSSASGGDSMTVYHQPGSKRVGVNDTAFTKIVGGDLQGALESVDGQLLTGETAGGDLQGTYPNPEVNDLTITGETTGDTLYYNGTNWVRLAVGTANQYLNGGTNPTWQQINTSELNNDANFVDNTHTHTSADVTDFDEAAQDAVGTILTDTTTIDFTYDDTANSVSASVIQSAINTASLNNDAGFISGISAEPIGDLSDVTITTGAGNLSDNDILAYDFGTGDWINQTAAGAGLAAAGHTHTSADVTDFTEAAQDVVGGILTDTSSIDFTYNDAGNTISATVIEGGVNTSGLNNDAGFVTDNLIGDAAGGDLGGTYPNPEVNDLTIANQSAGSMLYFNGTSWTRLSSGSTGKLLQANSTSAPSWEYLSGDVSGPVFNTSVTDLSITGQASGDILYYNGGWSRLAAGTSGQYLHTNGLPEWQQISTSELNNDAGFIDGVEIYVDGGSAVGTKPALNFVPGNNINIASTLFGSNIRLDISSKYDSGATFPTSPDDRQYFLYTDVTDPIVASVVNNTAGIGILLHYDAGTSTWKMPGTIPAGDAGGDLSGYYPEPSVINLTGLSPQGTGQGVGSVAYHSGTATEWYATEGGAVNDGDILYWDGVSSPPKPYWSAPPSGGSGLPSGTSGDMLVHNGSSWVTLGAGSNNQVLTANGITSVPSWQAVPSHTHDHGIDFFEAYNSAAQTIIGTSVLEVDTVRPYSTGMAQLIRAGVFEMQIGGNVAIDARVSFTCPDDLTEFRGWIEVNNSIVAGTLIHHTDGDPTSQITPWFGSITWNRVTLDVGNSDEVQIVIDITDHGAITTVIDTVSITLTMLNTTNTTP